MTAPLAAAGRLLESPRAVAVAVAALTALYVALGLHGLGAATLWNDEAFSFFVAWQGVAHTLHMVRQDTQPPLYYLALTGWLHLGHDVATLRALSLLALAPVPLLLFGAARRLCGVPVALLAVLLFVLGPENVAWMQRARPYPVQALLVAVGFWGFARLWGTEPRRPWLGWAAYVLGGGLAVMAQYPAVFYLLGCNAAMLARVARAWPAERRLAGRWVLAQVVMGLLWLPWLVAGVGQVSEHLTPGAIAARHTLFLVDAGWLRGVLLGLLGVPHLWRGAMLFAAVCAVLALAGIVALARAGRRGLPVLAVVLVPLAVCLLAWAVVHPVFGYVISTFLWLRAPYAILLAAGALALRPRLLGAALVGLLLLGDAWGLANVKAARNVPLDQVAALIAADRQPGDGLMLSELGAARWGLAYYLGPPFAGRIDGLDVADTPLAGWAIRDRARALRQRRLWVVVPDAEKPPFDPATLAPEMTEALRQRFGDLTVTRYDR